MELESDSDTQCQECDRSFGMPGLLSKHLLVIHGEEERLVCHECADPPTEFKRKMNFIIHFRSQAHREQKLLGCDICDAFLITNGFKDEEALEEHTKEIHGEDVTVNPKDRQSDFACPFCGSTFTHRKGMIEHVQVIHVEHLYKHCLKEADENLEVLMGNVRFSCKDCVGAQFRVKSTLNRHREKFHKDYSHWEKVQNRGNLPPEAIEAIKKAKSSPTVATPSPGISKRLSLPTKSLAGQKSSLASLKSKPGPSFASSAKPTSSLASPLKRGGEEAPKKYHSIFDKSSWKKSPFSSPAKTFSPQSSSSSPSSILTKISPLKSSTSSSTTTVAKCKFCGKCFTRPSVLTVHLEMVHRNEMASAKKGTIVGVKTVVGVSISSATSATAREGIKKQFSLPLKPFAKTNGFSPKQNSSPIKRFESISGANSIRSLAKQLATPGSLAKTEEKRNHSDKAGASVVAENGVRGRKRSLSGDDQAHEVGKPASKELKVVYPKGEQFPEYVHKSFEPSRQIEDCMVKSCPLKFISYFSMMRHVAFKHYPDKTARLMKVEPIVEWDLSGAGRDDLDQEEMPDKVTKKKEKKSGPKAAKREEALAAKKQIKVEVEVEEEEEEEEEEDEGKKSGPQRSVKENASPIDQEHSKDEDASNDDRGADQFSQEHQLTDEVVDEIEMIGIPEDEFV